MRMPKTAAGSAASGGAVNGAGSGAAASGSGGSGPGPQKDPGGSGGSAPRASTTAGSGGSSQAGTTAGSGGSSQAGTTAGSGGSSQAGTTAGSGESSQASTTAGSGESSPLASTGGPGGLTPPAGTAGLHGVGSGAAADLAATAPARRPAALLRRHWVAALLLTAGVALRILVQVSFGPALLYIDSVKYLYGAWPGADPLGYDAPLKLLLAIGNLGLVEAVQHLLGLGMAIAIYLVLLRRGVPRWLAALAMGPVLLDAYQLQTEATIMPDVWFEAVIVAGLAVLLWRSRPSLRACLLAGFILGLGATVRQVGEIMIVPAVLFVLVAAGGWRQALTKSTAVIVAFVVPIVAYCAGSYVMTGHFWLSRNGYQATYGRMAGLADCATLKLPAYERALCPTRHEQALGPDWLDHGPNSPLRRYPTPPGMVRSQVIGSFNRAVVTQQPLRVLSRISGDAAKLFAVTRVTSPGDTPISRWQFHTTYPPFAPTIAVGQQGTVIFALKLAVSGGPTVYRKLDAAYGGNATVWVPGAAFLRRYMLYGGYTPGPLLLLSLLTGLAGSLTVLRRRASAAQRQLAAGALLFTAGGVAILLMSDIFEFSWRYQMPALVTLPPAGAFGIATILRYARRRKISAAAAAVDREQRVTARTG
jgi:hypothetical protein